MDFRRHASLPPGCVPAPVPRAGGPSAFASPHTFRTRDAQSPSPPSCSPRTPCNGANLRRHLAVRRAPDSSKARLCPHRRRAPVRGGRNMPRPPSSAIFSFPPSRQLSSAPARPATVPGNAPSFLVWSSRAHQQTGPSGRGVSPLQSLALYSTDESARATQFSIHSTLTATFLSSDICFAVSRVPHGLRPWKNVGRSVPSPYSKPQLWQASLVHDW